MGYGLPGIVLVSETAGEDHVGGHAVALRETVHVLMRFSRVHVVDAQVECGTDFEFGQDTEGGHAASGDHQHGQGTAMDDAGLRIANDLGAIGQDDGEPLLAGAVDAQPKDVTVSQRRKKPRRALKNGVYGHVIITRVWALCQ